MLHPYGVNSANPAGVWAMAINKYNTLLNLEFSKYLQCLIAAKPRRGNVFIVSQIPRSFNSVGVT